MVILIQNLIKCTHDPAATEQELVTLAEYGAIEGTFEYDEKKMIERVFAFDEFRARDVVIPKHKLCTLDCEQTIGRALRKTAAQAYARFPFCSGKTDKITRVVCLRDSCRIDTEPVHMGVNYAGRNRSGNLTDRTNVWTRFLRFRTFHGCTQSV